MLRRRSPTASGSANAARPPRRPAPPPPPSSMAYARTCGRVPHGHVGTARISSVKAGLDIPLNDLEAHYLAGGNVVNVVIAMISADKANIALPFKRAAAIDL